jgi:hypothetical protein
MNMNCISVRLICSSQSRSCGLRRKYASCKRLAASAASLNRVPTICPVERRSRLRTRRTVRIMLAQNSRRYPGGTLATLVRRSANSLSWTAGG